MASKLIKGITIEIGGDTTKLGQALEGAEKSSRDLQGELKGVSTLLKFDPTNIEMLKQKQDLLTKSIEATESKLKTLKDAQKQVQAQFERGEITEQQYRDFQREIVATKKKLSELKEEQKQFGSVSKQVLDKASKDIADFGKNVEEAGQKLAGVSAAGAGALTGMAVSAMSLEEATNKYLGATGKSTAEAEKFKDVLTAIHDNNYGEDYAEIADKMRIVSNLLGDLPDEELQSVVEKAYLLQDAYDLDFQESIRGVNAMMDQFGLTSEQAFELINQGAQKGLNQNQDLTDQIAEYSTYYAKMGLSAEDMFNMMIAGAEDGAYQIDYLNDAIKEFGIRTKDNSASTNEAYEALGINAEKMNKAFAQGGDSAKNAFSEVANAIMAIEDPVKRNEIGVALFGTKFEDLEEGAIKAMTTAKSQVNSMGETVAQTEETMYGGASAEAQQAFRQMQTAFAELGTALLPLLTPLIEAITNLANWLKELSPVSQGVILAVTGIITALGPILIIIGKVASGISAVMGVVAKIGPILSKAPVILGAIKGAIMAIVGVLGWPVTIIMAIIGVIVLLWNKCEWFRDAVKALWEGIQAGFMIAVEWIKNALLSIGEFFVALWEGIKAVFSGTIEFFKMIFEGAWNAIKFVWDLVVAYYTGIWNGIKAVFNGVVTFFKNIFTNAWNAIKKAWSAVTSFFKSLWENIKKVFSGVVNFYKDIFTKAWNAIKTAWSGVGSFFSGIWNGIKSAFGSVTSWFKNTFTNAWTAVKNVFSTGGKIFTGIKDGIANTFKTVVNGIIGGINRVIAVPFNAINGMLNKIRNVSILGVSPFKGFWGQSPLKVPQIPKLKTGTNEILSEGLYHLHKGEAVVPEKYNPAIDNSNMKEALQEALIGFRNQRATNYSNNASGIQELAKLVSAYLPKIADGMNQNIVLDDGTLVGKMLPQIDRGLAENYSSRRRGR